MLKVNDLCYPPVRSWCGNLFLHTSTHTHTHPPHTLRHTATHAIRESSRHTHEHILDTYTWIQAYILTYVQRCTQMHAQRHTDTHTHTHTQAVPTSILLPSVFPATAHTHPAPLLWGRAGPSRKTGWQDSLPRLLSVLHGPPSQIPVFQHESRGEGPFIFGKGGVAASQGQGALASARRLVRIAWNEGSCSDPGTQQVLRKG